jgi:hypothetical protein
MFTTAPFTKLYAAARRGDPRDEALLNELGAYYTSRALAKPGAFRAWKEAEGNFRHPGQPKEEA